MSDYEHRKDFILPPRIEDNDAEDKKDESKEPATREQGRPRKDKEDVKIEIHDEPRKTTPENQSKS